MQTNTYTIRTKQTKYTPIQMAVSVERNNNMTAVQTTQIESPAGAAPATKPTNSNNPAKKQQPQPSYAKQQPSASPATRKHEEFKNQLVHDVFGRDNKGRVPMEKVTMLIWQFRDDPAVVQFMAQFVARVRFVYCVYTSFQQL